MTEPSAIAVIRSLERACLRILREVAKHDTPEKRLEEELNYYRLRTFPHCDREVFRTMCISLGNRQHAHSVIFGGDNYINDTLRRFASGPLFDFDPVQIVSCYDDDETLLSALLDARGLTAEQRMHQLSTPRSTFRQYSRGVRGAALVFSLPDFFSELRRRSAEAVDRPELASVLVDWLVRHKIFGLQKALASDFLKECGVSSLGKPDQRVLELMRAIGWLGKPSDCESIEDTVQERLRRASKELGSSYPPVIIDKLMFLVGSGRFLYGADIIKTGPQLPLFLDELKSHSLDRFTADVSP